MNSKKARAVTVTALAFLRTKLAAYHLSYRLRNVVTEMRILR
jgi:hypothetical protein